MIIRLVTIEAARWACACGVGLGVLWQVAERADRAEGEAVIHVAEPGGVVAIDGWTHPVDLAPGAPIVRSLRPGRHTMSMSLEGRVVHQETFALDPGGHAVLTAWDGSRQPSVVTARLASMR